MKLYKRENYLKQIRGFYNESDIIKVITGVRRCGKSSIMQIISEELISNNINQNNIIFINLDNYGYKNIKTKEQLETLINEKSKADGLKYLFIDEVQNVKGFEEVINAYRETNEYSIFITGSNSYLLSGELITKLTGRYIEFEISTLSFEEYIGMKRFYNIEVNSNLKEEFDKYIIDGGFPKSIFLTSIEDRNKYTESIVDEIFEKDIRRRIKIKNRSVFEKVKTYIINNFGSSTSITNILNELHKGGMDIKRETLHKYIQVLIDAKILIECKRFDLKTKKSINSEQKYYLSDLSFYYQTNVNNITNYGPVLENIVYNYAKSKNYKISIGRIGNTECDFILRSYNNNFTYVQVCMTLYADKDTIDREMKSLEMIKDNYPKYILTRDDPNQNINGVIVKSIPKMMSDGEFF